MTFDPFGDYEQRGYLRNKFALPHGPQLAQLEFNNFRTLIEDIMSWLETAPLTYETILNTHDKLFKLIYPWSGKDRSETAPDIAITRGGEDQMFCHPALCARAADYAFKVAENNGILRNAGTVYSLLCHSHPFLDGNGRTLLLVHTEMMRRSGAHICWEDVPYRDFLSELTIDLNAPEAGSLDRYLATHIVNSTRSSKGLKKALVDDPTLHGQLKDG